MHQDHHNELHVPVLLAAVLRCLEPAAGQSYLDLTAGYGGHADAIMERTKNPTGSVLIDRDAQAITVLSDRFKDQGAEILQRDFYGAATDLASAGRKFDLILADLGVSSPHLNDPDRGFSINQDGPLDMRMDRSQPLTAADIVNTRTESELADLLKRYGEEPKARAIARLIVHNRPHSSTAQLAAVVGKAWPGHSRIHPATRTFQALRIAVNDELSLLERSLPVWLDLLSPQGRLAVISFHSLEDRIVKQTFADRAGDRFDADFRLLTKRPLSADHTELVSNPRARSAKLRAVAK